MGDEGWRNGTETDTDKLRPREKENEQRSEPSSILHGTLVEGRCRQSGGPLEAGVRW